MECPFCGGEVVRVEITDSGGERAYSLCCNTPLEFIDNYDVFSALPERLRQVAIARKQAEYDTMKAKAREDARLFKAACERWNATHGWLLKGDRDGNQRQEAQTTGTIGCDTPGHAGGQRQRQGTAPGSN